MNGVVNDKRNIQMITFDDDSEYAVGGAGKVTAIVPYYEHGEMSEVPWFQIWRGGCSTLTLGDSGELVARVNGKYVKQVIYAP